jgi:2-dehydropantoate 2-reductase
MKQVKKALIVGAGAIGAAIASRIFETNPDSVAIMAFGERRDRYIREGFLVNGKLFQFHVANPESDGAFDCVIVAVKDYHLEEALEEMRPFVGGQTIIVSLLNGIGAEDRIRAFYGGAKVPLGFMIGIDALRERGEIRFLSIGEIRFGWEKNPVEVKDPTIEALKDFFSSHRVPFTIPEDMVKAKWYKFMLNVALNQWSAVLNAKYGYFMASEAAQTLLKATMLEVIAVSNACGTGLTPKDMEIAFQTLAKLDPDGKTSMHQDVEAGRKTEIEAFSGAVTRLSKQHGCTAPINEALYLALQSIEDNRKTQTFQPR